MPTHVERAKILQGFLQTNNNPKMEIGLIVGALKDAAAEAAELAVKTTREACAALVEKRIEGATGLARALYVEIARDIRLLVR